MRALSKMSLEAERIHDSGWIRETRRRLSFQKEEMWLDEEETVELEGREQSQDMLREWVQ